MARLLAHDISLFAYHLPLDAHPRWATTPSLPRLGWTVEGRFAEQDIGFFGVPPAPTSAGRSARQVEHGLGREPLLIGDPEREVKRIAWCSGGAQDYFEMRWPPAPTCLFPAKFQSRPCIWRAKPAWPSSPPGTTPPSVMASWPWAAICPPRFGIACEFVDIDNPA
jgi:hypothetical protein